MKEDEIFNLFCREYHGSVNVVTPCIIRYGSISDTLFYEISRNREGDTFFGNQILYGCTIIECLPDTRTKRKYELSICLRSIEEVEEYIKKLKEESSTRQEVM